METLIKVKTLIDPAAFRVPEATVQNIFRIHAVAHYKKRDGEALHLVSTFYMPVWCGAKLLEKWCPMIKFDFIEREDMVPHIQHVHNSNVDLFGYSLL